MSPLLSQILHDLAGHKDVETLESQLMREQAHMCPKAICIETTNPVQTTRLRAIIGEFTRKMKDNTIASA